MQGFIPHRILVPINGSPTDEEAVRLACRLARRARATVNAITVLEVKRSLALGSVSSVDTEKAEMRLDEAVKLGVEYEIDVGCELLQAREAGPAIVDEISEWRADLVVLGLPFRERFGEFYMGKTAPYVLRFAPCRALLFREPIEAGERR